MFETESKRRIKSEPAIAYDLPQRSWFPSTAVMEEGETCEIEKNAREEKQAHGGEDRSICGLRALERRGNIQALEAL